MTEKTAPPTVRRKRNPSERGDTTETEFLDAAERQFAENGYAGAKIRAIADEAKANLGALHYYWGSKESLFRAVCRRRMAPMIEERMARFDALGQGGAPRLEDILRAHFEPAFFGQRDDMSKRRVFCQTYSRILTDPSPEVKAIMQEIFEEPTVRFVDLLRRACPHIDDQAFYWRLHGVFGAFQYAARYTEDIGTLAGSAFDGADFIPGLDRIIEFVAGGLRAPAS
jgi:AcrR family transcriptional regulator